MQFDWSISVHYNSIKHSIGSPVFPLNFLFCKRNRKTCFVLLLSYNFTQDVERTLKKHVQHFAIASCFTRVSRVLSTSLVHYNSIKACNLLTVLYLPYNFVVTEGQASLQDGISSFNKNAATMFKSLQPDEKKKYSDLANQAEGADMSEK